MIRVPIRPVIPARLPASVVLIPWRTRVRILTLRCSDSGTVTGDVPALSECGFSGEGYCAAYGIGLGMTRHSSKMLRARKRHRNFLCGPVAENPAALEPGRTHRSPQKEPDQGSSSKNRTLRVSEIWAKWSGTSALQMILNGWRTSSNLPGPA